MKNDVVILIAEDDRGHFVLTRHCLRRGGLSNDIIWLEDGQETLDFLCGMRNRPTGVNPDTSYVLLLDIRMPKVDGVQILQKLKADDQLKNMPVIIVTTSDSPANIDICNRLGCDDYVTKPLDESIAQTIKQACKSI